MKKLKYYFTFSYLKPSYFWPIRILLILYFLIIYAGLVYDLLNPKIEYYSDTSEYLNILFSDSSFYYLYVLPVFVIYIFSVFLEFILTIDKNKNIRKK